MLVTILRQVVWLVALLVFISLSVFSAAGAATTITLDGSGQAQDQSSSGTVTITATNDASPPSVAAPAPEPATAAALTAGGSGGGCSFSSDQYLSLIMLPVSSSPGTWGFSSCGDGVATPEFVPNAQPAAPTAAAAVPPPPSPQELAEQAEGELQLSAPPLALSPAVGADQIVRVPTWAWLPPADFGPLVATAVAGPVVVTATATPERIDVTYEDGGAEHNITCAGAGTPYSDVLAERIDPGAPVRAASPTCGWTFENSSAGASDETVPVTADVSYDVTWTVTGAAGGGDLGVLVSPPTDDEVRVAEVQALVVPSR